jgi:hypothetical protein
MGIMTHPPESIRQGEGVDGNIDIPSVATVFADAIA